MLPSLDDYLYAKNLRNWSISSISRDTDDKKMLHYDLMKGTAGHTQLKVVVSDAAFPRWLTPWGKKLRCHLILSRDIDGQRILRSNWTTGTAGHTQLKEVVPGATFAWWLFPCKKPKRFLYFFQRYWWSKNSAVCGTADHTQPKEVVSATTFLWWIAQSKKFDWWLLEILIIKELSNLIGWEHFRS